jgi:hypothetical protein
MPLNPITATHFTEMVLADAAYLRSVIRWMNEKYKIWSDSSLVNETLMTGYGYDSTQMVYVEAFIADMARMIAASNGTATSAGDPIEPHLRGLLGLD